MTTSPRERPVSGPALGIVAGKGPLPLAVADAAAAKGRPVFIVGIRGRSNRDIERHRHAWVRYGALGRTLDLLKQAGCRDLVMIGPLDRPRLFHFWPDLLTLSLIPRLLRLLRKGDDGLLSGVVEYFEKEHGFRILPAEEVASGLVAPPGLLTETGPTPEEERDIRRGIAVVHEHGAADLGQAAVIANGEVLAVEDQDGTDAMLRRIAERRPPDRPRQGILVKLPKPGQERRVDLPTLGVLTVENAAAAGLAGIAYEAQGALIADIEGVAACANELGLFVIGLPAGTSEERV